MSDPDLWVRVTDKSTGHKYTVRQSAADANPDAYRVLKQDAVDHNGDPLPPEFAESTSGSGAAVSGHQADNTKKESD